MMKRVLFAGLLAIAGVSVSAQNLIKNNTFATEVTSKLANPNKATAGEWFFVNNEADGATTIAWEKTTDAQYPTAMKIDNSGAEKNTSWYKAYLGQRITDGLQKGIYTLTFYVKAKEAGTQVGAYIKQTNEQKDGAGKSGTTFFIRKGYDAESQLASSAAQYNYTVKSADKWTKVVVNYDMTQVVNSMSSKKSNPDQTVSDTADDAAILKDCFIAILVPNKGSVVEITDVTLQKK